MAILPNIAFLLWSVAVLGCFNHVLAQKATSTRVAVLTPENHGEHGLTNLVKSSDEVLSFSTLSDLNFIRTLVGTGVAGYNGDGISGVTARLNSPVDLAVDREGNIYIADDSNNRLRKLTISTGLISTVAGTLVAGYNGDDIDATTASLNTPEGVGVDPAGNVYIADTLNHRLRKVTVSTGKITTIAGTGSSFGTPVDGILATRSTLSRPSSVAVDTEGNIYIADSANHRIRKVSGSTGIISTVAGTGVRGYNQDGIAATTATLSSPLAVAVDAAGNIYIADSFNNRLRKVTLSTGIIETIAGTGTTGFNADKILATTSRLYNPKGVAIDRLGNVFIADSENYRIRKVIVSTGIITTIAGTGIAGFTGDGVNATSARLNYVTGIAVDATDNFYIADTSNHRIRSMTGERRTGAPSAAPSVGGTPSPTTALSTVSPSPTAAPMTESTAAPTAAPNVVSASPSAAPMTESSAAPTAAPNVVPTACLTPAPIVEPTAPPSTGAVPTCKDAPTKAPVSCRGRPTRKPTCKSNRKPTRKPTNKPKSKKPTSAPSM